LRVNAVFLQQFVVAALFDDAAPVQDDEAVHCRDGGKAVRDGNHRFSCHQAVQAGLDGCFHFAIQRRGGFVQDEDGRVFEQDAGDGDTLPLPAGEFDTTFADLRVEAGIAVAVGKTGNEVARFRLFDGTLQFFFGRVRATVEDVVAH